MINRLQNPRVYLPLAILFAGICGAALMVALRDPVETRHPEPPPPLVRTMTVAPRDIQLTVTAHGEVAPKTESALVAQAAGQVLQIAEAFANGGFFERGDILVQIDPRDYELAVAKAGAQMAQTELAVAREEEESGIARREWARVGTGDATPLALREPQLAEAKASLAAASASLELARLNLSRTRVRAPYAGRVRAKSVDIGQYVTPGAVLARLYSVDFAEVRLPVPDGDLAYLDLDYRRRKESSIGPSVHLKANFAGKWNTWEGHVVRMEGELDPRSRMVNLVARIPDPYESGEDPHRPPLTIGLFVEAEIAGRHVKDAFVLPRQVLRGRNEVLIVDPSDRLYFRTVDVLKTDNESVVIQSGLARGERVCLSPMDVAVDGMKVRVYEDNQIPDTAERGDAQ